MRELKECVLAECIEEYEDCTERSEDIFEKGNVPHGWTVIAQLTDNKGKRDPEYPDPVGYAMVGENTTIYFADAHDALAATNYPCVPVVLWRAPGLSTRRRTEQSNMPDPDAWIINSVHIDGGTVITHDYYSRMRPGSVKDNAVPLLKPTAGGPDASAPPEGPALAFEARSSDGKYRRLFACHRCAADYAEQYLGTLSSITPLYKMKSQ